MKLCMVYNPNDSKLHSNSYCSIFKDMFDALVKEFSCRQFVTSDCNAVEIDADVIFFFDPHATHHIEINGIENHPAKKFEYWNDVHQVASRGVHRSTGVEAVKLGREQRAERTKKRGVDYIVTAAKYKFLDLFKPFFGDGIDSMVLHFPHAPSRYDASPQLASRKSVVLGNGATHGGWNGGYDFRKWAFEQSYVEYVQHAMFDDRTPKGKQYMDFIADFAGALALCTPFPVPKHSEIPMAGCVMFTEDNEELRDLGFKDYESCIVVNRETFQDRVKAFLEDPNEFQDVANAGRNLMLDNYTAAHFARFIRESA